MIITNDMKFIELFAGIGGFRYGLEKLQFKDQNLHKPTSTIRNQIRHDKQLNNGNNKRLFTCIWANEWDKYACKIYRKNFGKGELVEGDIRTINTDDIPNCDLLTAGFPCQAFSIAGKRKGFDDTRGTLFFEIGRILRHKKPRYFILENVGGLLSHDNGRTFEIIITSLNELGYDVQWQVLNSKDFGVPQNRARVFIIGYIRGERRPEIFPFREDDKEDNRTIGENVSYSIDANYYKGTNNITDGRRQLVGIKREQFDISGKEYKSQQDRVYHTEGIMACLPNANPDNKLNIFQGNKIRRLTPIECERLQGFPDNWTEGVSDTQRYKMLGNAITTNVITEIGKRLLNRTITNGVD